MSREDTIYYAKLAEQAERYDDMVKHMKEIATSGTELSNEERNLLSVAYKNSVGSKRTAWRAVTAIEQKEEAKGSKFLEIIRQYKTKVEGEVETVCNDIVDVLDKHLIAKATDAEASVFYLKMKGDYYRYMAECMTGEKNKKAADKANEAYKLATEKAGDLKTTHPIRLGLALNYSVFHYEILNSPEQACKLAKTAFDSAIGDLEGLDDEQYKDSATIMQLLRDNLTLCTADTQEEEGAGKDKEKEFFLRLKAYTRAYWRFEQPRRMGMKSILYYNEYPAEVDEFKFKLLDGSLEVSKKDLGFTACNFEHSWGKLI